MTILGCLVLVSIVVPAQTASPAAGAGPIRDPPGTAAQSLATTFALPVSIERIQRALARPPAIRLTTDTPVFRIEVLGRKPTIMDFLGPDYLKGPVPYGGLTHSEFLNMVTPTDVQGYAAFSNAEAFTVAATSFALKWALQKAIRRFENAQKEREREAARAEVQDALAALAKARQRAGLPPQ